jgi:hypothetical protein
METVTIPRLRGEERSARFHSIKVFFFPSQRFAGNARNCLRTCGYIAILLYLVMFPAREETLLHAWSYLKTPVIRRYGRRREEKASGTYSHDVSWPDSSTLIASLSAAISLFDAVVACHCPPTGAMRSRAVPGSTPS